MTYPAKSASLLALAASALLLHGCGTADAAEVKDCEAKLMSGLEAPATYKRISAETKDLTPQGTKHQAVTIAYDAANDEGVSTRQTARCRYLFNAGTKTVDLGAVARVYPGRRVILEGRMVNLSSLPKDEQEPLLYNLAVVHSSAAELPAKKEEWKKLEPELRAKAAEIQRRKEAARQVQGE